MRTIEKIEMKNFRHQLEVRMHHNGEWVYTAIVQLDNIDGSAYESVDEWAELEFAQIKEQMMDAGLDFLKDGLQEDQLKNDVRNAINPHIWDVELRTITTTREVYTFDELSEDGKLI